MARDDYGGMQKGTRETLSAKVQILRKERAWSQDQLAGASEVSLRTVQRVENGKAASPETLQAFAAAFGVNIKALTSCQNGKPDKLHELALVRFGLTRKQANFLAVGMLAILLAVIFAGEGHFHFFKHLFN